MDVTPQTDFDALLETAKASPPGTLKAADIKRLLGAAGKRPAEIQLEKVVEMISSSPKNDRLVFELLGELETTPKRNLKIGLLKPLLSRIAEAWFSSWPPPDQNADGMPAWLRMQFEPLADGAPIGSARLRGVSLLLLQLHQTPTEFLTCLREVGPLMGLAVKPSGKASTRQQGTRSGFIMEGFARAVFAAAKGEHPKFSKIAELSSAVETVLTHLREREAAAESAIERLEQVEGALTEQRRVNSEQAEANSKLEREKAAEGAAVVRLTAESVRWKQLHEQAFNHTTSAVAEGRKTLLTELQSKILPKVGDARLYANRPSPVVDQVLRLLGEIEQTLQNREGQR